MAKLRWLIAAAVLIAPAASGRERVDRCAVREQVFLSPAGEPFRAAPGAPAPVAIWFRKADGNGDDRLDRREVEADAARFFAVVDTDRNGEIIPDELSRYEREVAPEIGIYDPSPLPREGSPSRRLPYGGPLGGGRFALTNIPNPIAAADADLNRGTTRAELSSAVGQTFASLSKTADGVRLSDLPLTPQAAMLAACAIRKRRK